MIKHFSLHMKKTLFDNKLALISTKHNQGKLFFTRILAAIPLHMSWPILCTG
jgi:hypothetical protein